MNWNIGLINEEGRLFVCAALWELHFYFILLFFFNPSYKDESSLTNNTFPVFLEECCMSRPVCPHDSLSPHLIWSVSLPRRNTLAKHLGKIISVPLDLKTPNLMKDIYLYWSHTKLGRLLIPPVLCQETVLDLSFVRQIESFVSW